MKLTRHTWTRFFTWTYWRFQLAALWGGKVGLNVIETFEFELPEHPQVPTHSQRVYGELWQNGAFIEVLVYEQHQPGEDESDRIHLLITDCDGERRGWLMNIEDAKAIIKGLQTGIAKVRLYGVPAQPQPTDPVRL